MNLWQDRSWQVMLLKEVSKPFDAKDFLYELKFDGIRAVIYATPTSMQIISRNKKDLTHLFPELEKIKNLVTTNTIFDGEIISFHDNLPSFSKLQKRIRVKDTEKITYLSKEEPVIFVAFDILYENKDLTKLPLLKRKKILNKYPDNSAFIKSKWIKEKGINLFNEVEKLNLEGIVAKRIDSIYLINTRTDNWLKIKNFKKDYFYIGGYEENKSTYTISLLLGEYHDKKFYYVGKVTLGKKNTLYKTIKEQKVIKKSPFIDYNEPVFYFKPKLTCLVYYLERTPNNHLRQPFLN